MRRCALSARFYVLPIFFMFHPKERKKRWVHVALCPVYECVTWVPCVIFSSRQEYKHKNLGQTTTTGTSHPDPDDATHKHKESRVDPSYCAGFPVSIVLWGCYYSNILESCCNSFPCYKSFCKLSRVRVSQYCSETPRGEKQIPVLTYFAGFLNDPLLLWIPNLFPHLRWKRR